jgi:hypothetical protein
MKRSRSPEEPAKEADEPSSPSELADEPTEEDFVVSQFFVHPPSSPAVLFGNVKPGRVREHMAPFLLPVLADIVSGYAAYAFTSFGYPDVLLFIVDDQLICLHDGEARAVATPFVPRYIADEMDSDVGVWDMKSSSGGVWCERRKMWNGQPNDGVARMITTGISRVPRSRAWPDDTEAPFAFVGVDGYDILDGYNYDLENVAFRHGTVSVRDNDTLTIITPLIGPLRYTILALPEQLRTGPFDVYVGRRRCVVAARECGNLVLYQAARGEATLKPIHEEDDTTQIDILAGQFGIGHIVRLTRTGCLWLDGDTVCSLRDVRSIVSNGDCLLIDHATLGYNIVSYAFDEAVLQSQLYCIAERAVRR